MPKYYKLLQSAQKQINFSARSKTHLTDFWLPQTDDKTSENCRRLGKLNIYCYKRKCPLKCSREWVVIEQENPNLNKKQLICNRNVTGLSQRHSKITGNKKLKKKFVVIEQIYQQHENQYPFFI